MRERLVPEKYVKLVQDMYTGCRTKVRTVKSCHTSKNQFTNDSFTIWDSTFRKQTRCTTELWSSKQSSQDIIICNIQTMKASDYVIPP